MKYTFAICNKSYQKEEDDESGDAHTTEGARAAVAELPHKPSCVAASAMLAESPIGASRGGAWRRRRTPLDLLLPTRSSLPASCVAAPELPLNRAKQAEGTRGDRKLRRGDGGGGGRRAFLPRGGSRAVCKQARERAGRERRASERAGVASGKRRSRLASGEQSEPGKGVRPKNSLF